MKERDPLYIIAIDFDDCIYAGGWPDITKGHIIQSTVDRMKGQLAANPHTEFVLWTCRSGYKLEDAKQVIKEYNLPIKYFNEHHPSTFRWFEGRSPKIYAHEYWDDKAVTVKEEAGIYGSHQLLHLLAQLGLTLSDPRTPAVVCAILGHSNVVRTSMAQVSCARCDALLGDTLRGNYDLKEKVIVNSCGCSECQTAYNEMSWEHKLLVTYPFTHNEGDDSNAR
jgi:hypothetical protein